MKPYASALLGLLVLLGHPSAFAGDRPGGSAEAAPPETKETKDAGTADAPPAHVPEFEEVKGRIYEEAGKDITFSIIYRRDNSSNIPREVLGKVRDATWLIAPGSRYTYITVKNSALKSGLKTPYENQRIILRGRVNEVDLADAKNSTTDRKAYVIACSSVEPYYRLEPASERPDLSTYETAEMQEIRLDPEAHLGRKVHLALRMGSFDRVGNKNRLRHMQIETREWFAALPFGRQSEAIELFVHVGQPDDIAFFKEAGAKDPMHVYGRVARVPRWGYRDVAALVVDRVLAEPYSGETAAPDPAPPADDEWNADATADSAAAPKEPAVLTPPEGPALRITQVDLGQAPERYAGRLVRFRARAEAPEALPAEATDQVALLRGRSWRKIPTRNTPLETFVLLLAADDPNGSVAADRTSMEIEGFLLDRKSPSGRRLFLVTKLRQ
jgi:hypothetical protein